MRLLNCVLLSIPLASCGLPDGCFFCTPPPPLSPSFLGSWSASTTLTRRDDTTVVFDNRLDLTVSSDWVSATGLCPDGSGSIQAYGSGTDASWQGQLVCPAAALGECDSVVVSFTSVALTLTPDARTLNGSGRVKLVECGTSDADATWQLDAAR